MSFVGIGKCSFAKRGIVIETVRCGRNDDF